MVPEGSIVDSNTLRWVLLKIFPMEYSLHENTKWEKVSTPPPPTRHILLQRTKWTIRDGWLRGEIFSFVRCEFHVCVLFTMMKQYWR